MKIALIGNTGFVGKNLKEQFHFEDEYNSTNISDIQGKEYDLIICAAIPASMWMANNFPTKDLENIDNLLSNIGKVKTKKFILISSICVFKQPVINIDEDSKNFEDELAYGKNRRYAEQEIIKLFQNSMIIRLPALFGKYLKKNFIYDLLNQEPAFITDQKFQDILQLLNHQDQQTIQDYYVFDNAKNIWSLHKEVITNDNQNHLLNILRKAKFSALNFTNSQSNFQYYDLSNLKKDIEIALKNNIKILHLCSEKISAKLIAKKFFNIDFDNDNSQQPFDFDLKTKYAHLWNNHQHYQYSQQDILEQLRKFFKNN